MFMQNLAESANIYLSSTYRGASAKEGELKYRLPVVVLDVRILLLCLRSE